MSDNDRRILYIQDDPYSRVLVHRVLTARGYTVLEAEDGTTGITIAQEVVPDLILMDLSMPGMDGYEVSRRIKSIPQLQHIPIVALTAHAMRGDREKALAAGCNGYIPKPIDIKSLPEQIARFLEARGKGQEARSKRQRDKQDKGKVFL